MLKKSKESKGFTLIEVVIVLAIAALIILVVLQAVGAAQRSNRDTARKSEAARVVSLLEQYASNNGGQYPASSAALDTMLTTYDNGLSTKYGTSLVGLAYASSPTASWADTKCPTVISTTYTLIYTPSTAATPRDYNLAVCLENGKSSELHPQ